MTAVFDARREGKPMNRQSVPWLATSAAIFVISFATVHAGPMTATAKMSGDESSPAAPKGAGRITGRAVKISDGSPAAGADVVLLSPPPKGQDAYYGKMPVRQVQADATGQFSFEGLAPGRYGVWANLGKLTSRRQRARGEAVVIPELGEAPKPIELRLATAVVVTARVKDKDTGRPIAGATVHLGWSDFPDDVTTDRDGVALLRPLTKERWMVEAWGDGHAKLSRWVNLETGADVDADFLLGPGGDLEGTVSDPAGRPVAGVGLSAFAEGGHEQLEYVTTGKDGRYRLGHLPRNLPLEITVSKIEYLRQPIPARVDGVTQRLDVTIRPRPHGGSIVGVVVDAKGRPIAGAGLSNTGHSSNEVREAKSGLDGRFRLENLYENDVGKEVTIRAKGSSPKRVTVEPGPAEKPAEVTITMEPGHRILGRVVDDKGKPLVGVDVYFANGENAFTDGGQSRTDKNGDVSFDSLPSESPFTFSKAGYSRIQGRKLPLDGNEVVTVVMIPSGVIAGRVLDSITGKPVRSFNVRITFSPRRQPDEPSSGLLSSLSDPGSVYQSDEGRFLLGDLVAGMPLQVMIAADGYERYVAERIVATRSDSAKIEEFSLDPIDPASLRTYGGRLLDASGKPIAGAQVRLIAARARTELPPGSFPFNWQMIRSKQIAQAAGVTRFLEAATDGQGRFSFAKVPNDDAVELVWWGKGVPPGRSDHLELREEKVKEAIEIKVPAPGRIVGAIDRKAFGAVARISVSRVEGAVDVDDVNLKPGQEDYEIADLPAGEYHVSLMSPYERIPGRPGSLTSRPVASGKIVVDEGGTSRVDFR
ncbi:MAG: hypothetical protein JWN86_2726 [Planctomycetota bacterium]|nr:hypothetical protein [Planctomycetota bacterium]